jgi:hypothetical protein
MHCGLGYAGVLSPQLKKKIRSANRKWSHFRKVANFANYLGPQICGFSISGNYLWTGHLCQFKYLINLTLGLPCSGRFNNIVFFFLSVRKTRRKHCSMSSPSRSFLWAAPSQLWLWATSPTSPPRPSTQATTGPSAPTRRPNHPTLHLDLSMCQKRATILPSHPTAHLVLPTEPRAAPTALQHQPTMLRLRHTMPRRLPTARQRLPTAHQHPPLRLPPPTMALHPLVDSPHIKHRNSPFRPALLTSTAKRCGRPVRADLRSATACQWRSVLSARSLEVEVPVPPAPPLSRRARLRITPPSSTRG